MRASRPQKVEGDNYVIAVENPNQQDIMAHAMPDILNSIHNSLSNDYITISIHINEGEAAPHTWNEREVYAHIVETTPYLKTVIEDLKLTLS
jgi:hypothetical protein